jgi:HSP20 family protein
LVSSCGHSREQGVVSRSRRASWNEKRRSQPGGPDGVLTLSGERKFEEPANGVEYKRTERVAGKFSRSFYLPQTVKHDGINATYRDGILEIHVLKAEEAKPKQITISVKYFSPNSPSKKGEAKTLLLLFLATDILFHHQIPEATRR